MWQYNLEKFWEPYTYGDPGRKKKKSHGAELLMNVVSTRPILDCADRETTVEASCHRVPERFHWYVRRAYQQPCMIVQETRQTNLHPMWSRGGEDMGLAEQYSRRIVCLLRNSIIKSTIQRHGGTHYACGAAPARRSSRAAALAEA